MRCPCGADQFLVERLVRPAGLPIPPYHTEMALRAQPVYRYRCAECGVLYGSEAQPKVTIVNPIEPESTPPPAPKRRGRPPKNAK